MIKSSNKEIHETIKTMLSYALALSESPIVTVFELGHYLADNIIAKVCLAVAIEKGEELQTYKITKKGNKWTKKFKDLYNDHLKKHYPHVPDYDPEIKEYHEERNVYQHDVESFDATMRPPRAKSYVELAEVIMKIAGIIKSGEIIRPSSLNPFGASDLSSQQDKTLEAKFQIKEIISILEKYESIKQDVDLEKKAVQELAIVFPSLVTANIGFKYLADARPNRIKDDNYTVCWSPIGMNPTTKFYIRRMENRVKEKKPEEAYYSVEYVKNQPDRYNEKAVQTLNEFIEYLKEK